MTILPLYEGSKISATASSYSLMQYAVENHLSYKAVEDLIALLQVYSHYIDQHELGAYTYFIRYIVQHLIHSQATTINLKN